MSEPKLISPMLDGFSMGEAISNHHGVRCCPAMPDSSDSKYIVKIISIPASQVQLQALLLTGAYQNEAAARDYFLELAQGVVAEADILTKLSKMEGFLAYEDRQLVPMENEVGYDVYLLGPYKRSLAKHLRRSNLSHLAAVNLGLDICASLAVCRQAGYLYADLKPENIFICNDKEYRIGDLGFLKLDSLKYASLPERYISAYSAPEIVDAFSDVNPTIDVYAAGLILYQVYNGGSLPFKGRAPAQELPSPIYADYEMAEIILKACAPDPKDRWQDPVAMGQAIVAYMQRNVVNDTPIVISTEEHRDDAPPAAEEASAEETSEAPEQETPQENTDNEQICLDEFYELIGEDGEEPQEAPSEEPEESADSQPEEPQEEVPAEETQEDEEDLLNLSFLDEMVGDDTAPSEDMAEGIDYEDLSSDASSILAQADDLISHETPEGVVAPEGVEIPMPDPIVLPPDEPEEPAHPEDEATRVIAPAVHDDEEEEEEADFDEEYDEDDDDGDEDWDDEEGDEENYTATDWKRAVRKKAARKRAARKKAMKKWLAVIFVLLLLGALAYGGWRFYEDYYLRSVTSLTLSGSEDQLVVNVVADVDEELLTVFCIDTYGTSQESPVKDGKAVFTGLNPNTLYRVNVQVSGMHKLDGETSDSYTTPVQTDILTFSAVTGTEEGTAILSFTVDGMDSDTWAVIYSAEGVEEQKQIFSGHMVTVSGLVSGKTYTFRLEAGSDLYITGNDQLEFTAQDPVFAENLAIVAATADSLQVQWDTPADVQVQNWTVRCYSESGYDQTVVTEETTVTFTGLNGNEAHTVEVTAHGMSAGNRCYMTANAVTVTNVTATKVDDMNMKLTWDFTGNEPEGQWILTYNVDGAGHQEMVRTDTNSAVISPLVPGATYTVSILLEDGTTVFTEPFMVTAPAANKFSGYFTGADYITASMCRTPDKANWDRNDLAGDDYTDTFVTGEKGSFVLYTSRNYDPVRDVILTMFVIHKEDGTLVSSNITQEVWRNMWYKRYCELDIPALPTEAGNYTIAIYFNGDFVHSQSFTITAE